ncbi:MAG: UDP-N-acetylglucosamine 2-epimerase [Candidatus Saccharimonadales bacterium]
MLECEKQGLEWRWIYTAQHKETIAQSLETFQLPLADYTIFDWDSEAKTMGKVWYWFLRILLQLSKGKKIFAGYTGKKHIVLTHGDTLTTWWGALLGRLYGCQVMHVEAGLRSFNIFKPFPEEINRLITFRLANYYACPGDWAVENLTKYKGVKINTHQNTQLDTLMFGLKNCDRSEAVLPNSKYVVASIHRYENIFNQNRFSDILEKIKFVSDSFIVLFVQHPATEEQLKKFNLMQNISNSKKIKLLPRLEYLDFIKTVKHSEFVITDGGGNQEELYHMGKPTLIFRNETERQEGLGVTAVISKLDDKIINSFIDNYKDYERKKLVEYESPSEIIANHLKGMGYGK